MSDPGRLRASDVDREHAAEHLPEDYAARRLTSQEFSERLDAVYAAATTGELATLDRHERRRLEREERRDRRRELRP